MGTRYTPLKIFHYTEKLASLAKDAETTPPLHIRIKPTNVCCHRCRYCAYRSPDLALGGGMDTRHTIPREKMLEIVEDVIAMGVRAVTFSGGGEPFCYAHLAETARRLAESPVRFAALTNGSRLEGEAAEIFARHASWVRVSMDGWDGESYARYRDVSNLEFGRVLGNIEQFKALGGPCHLGVSLIVDRENAGHVHDFVRLVKSAGADSIKISPCITSNSGQENRAYHEPIFDLVTVQIARATHDFAGDGFEIHNAFHQMDTVFDKPYHWCPYLQVLPVIGADLRVYSCQDKAYTDSGALGSIEHMRFREFWMNGREKFFGIDPARDCKHHCVADGKNRLIHDFLAVDREHLGFV